MYDTYLVYCTIGDLKVHIPKGLESSVLSKHDGFC